jgi:hypothetical protein
MSNNDQLTEDAELRELRDCLSGIAMPGRPRLEAITARGRAHRRHRLSAVAGLSAASAAAGTALALALTGVLGAASTPGTIRTAAFTLSSNSNGTATLTINPNELFDPTTLQNDLQQYGIPAIVTSGSFCSSDPAPAGFDQAVSMQPAGEATVTPHSGVDPTITFDPSAIPSGTELSFGDFQLSTGEQQATLALVDTSSYTCSNTPPPPPPDGSQFLYGGSTGS